MGRLESTVKRQIPLGGNILLAATICAFLVAPFAHAQVQWAERIASTTSLPGGGGPLIGLTLDSQANCYVTGWFDGTNNFGGVTLTNQSVGGSDIFVAKYNSTGALQWAHRAGGTSANINTGRRVGVDTNGNVYVAGHVYGPASFDGINLPASTYQNFFLAKYDAAGGIQWVRQSVAGYDIRCKGFAVDGAGNSYALLYLMGTGNVTLGTTNVNNPLGYASSLVFIKYDNTGSVQWAQLLGAPGGSDTSGCSVAADAAGNVYVCGLFEASITIGTTNLTGSASSWNIFIAKFNSSGALTWVQQPTGGNPSAGVGAAVDPAGNAYLAGQFTNTISFGGISVTNGGGFVAKYSSSGAIQWADQAAVQYDDVALDGQTNVYAAGLLNFSAAVAKHSPTGTLQWAYSASGPPVSPYSSVAMKCAGDSAGHCYLVGWYQGTNTFGTNVLQSPGVWNFFLAKVGAPAPLKLGIFSSNGVPRVSFAGDIGSTYSLQWSPKVAATNTPWQTLTTLTLTNGPLFYLDTTVPSRTNRFYRAGPPVLFQSSTSTNPPATSYGAALIPAGSFTMGDALDGDFDATPTVSVYVSAFYMDTNLVSYSQWQAVYNWATNAGYGFDNAGSGHAANLPVQRVNWYDVVKWSNARSQQVGLTPVYYTDAGLTQVYTNGDTDAVYPNWAATGYRLPTEAEWEKAARGGLSGLRFPWGNTISESQANYFGDTVDYSYDLGPNGQNPAGTGGGSWPYTSPVGSFAANGYGLYDMAGNVEEWCWDWYEPGSAGGSDPRGPGVPPFFPDRVMRGGPWDFDAHAARCGFRFGDDPAVAAGDVGFRCVRGS